MDSKFPSFYLLLSLLSFSFVSLCFSIAADPSAYDILQEYGLPRGLLPDSVKSYSLSEDGAFEVKLEKPCYVKFDYLTYYEKKITGKLKIGSISGLKGIQVQRFFLWLDVDEIKVDLPPSNNIYFTVGIINKKLDVGQFQTIHSCRDNKACTTYGGGALRFFSQGIKLGILTRGALIRKCIIGEYLSQGAFIASYLAFSKNKRGRKNCPSFSTMGTWYNIESMCQTFLCNMHVSLIH